MGETLRDSKERKMTLDTLEREMILNLLDRVYFMIGLFLAFDAYKFLLIEWNKIVYCVAILQRSLPKIP